MKEERFTLTPEGLHECAKNNLFILHEKADNLECIVSKCDAVTDIFEEALESMSDKGIRPTDDTTLVDVVRVIHDYSDNAKRGIRKLESDLSELHAYLCNKGGECHE